MTERHRLRDKGIPGLSKHAARKLLSDESETDFFMHLVGETERALLDPTDVRHAPYFEWLARVTRAHQTPAERDETERAASRFARRVRARIALEKSRVQSISGWPTQERQRQATRIALSVDRAARRRMAAHVERSVAAGDGREIWEETCDLFVRLPHDLPVGRYVSMPVAGDSMTPLMHAGDIILVRLCQEVHAGDVVVARCGDRGYVMKSVGVVRCDTVELVPFNPEFEPIEVPLSELAMLGSVMLRWCAHDPSPAT